MTNGATRLTGYVALLAAGLAAPFLFPAYQSQMAELWLFIVFALTWDLVGGQMGYNSFGNVVFLGVGMYACALTQVGLFYDVSLYNQARGGGATIFTFDWQQYLKGLSVGLPVGAVLAALTAACLGALVLGMRGQYFAICTLGLGIAAGEIANGWDWIGAGSGMVPPTHRMTSAVWRASTTISPWCWRFSPFSSCAASMPPISVLQSMRSAMTRTRRNPWVSEQRGSR